MRGIGPSLTDIFAGAVSIRMRPESNPEKVILWLQKELHLERHIILKGLAFISGTNSYEVDPNDIINQMNFSLEKLTEQNRKFDGMGRKAMAVSIGAGIALFAIAPVFALAAYPLALVGNALFLQPKYDKLVATHMKAHINGAGDIRKTLQDAAIDFDLIHGKAAKIEIMPVLENSVNLPSRNFIK